jgi:hypothetical protein
MFLYDKLIYLTFMKVFLSEGTKMKRIILAVVLIVCTGFAVFAQSESDFEFSVGSGLVWGYPKIIDETPEGWGIIIRYKGYNTDVVIPATINGTPVKGIGPHAFDSSRTGIKLTSVVIPEGVEEIASGAFQNNRLFTVTIPDSVTTIGGLDDDFSTGAFGDNYLRTVIFSDKGNLKSIGYGTFSGNLLAGVIIPEGVDTIGGSAFSGNNLTSVTIPESVRWIYDYAFGNNLLTTVTIPGAVDMIGKYAFASNKLESVVIYPSSNPDNLSRRLPRIPDNAFENNPGVNIIYN